MDDLDGNDDYQVCHHCNHNKLHSTDEQELNICDTCADRQYDNYGAGQTWIHSQHS